MLEKDLLAWSRQHVSQHQPSSSGAITEGIMTSKWGLAVIRRVKAVEPIGDDNWFAKIQFEGTEQVEVGQLYRKAEGYRAPRVGDHRIFIVAGSRAPTDNPLFAELASTNFRVERTEIRGQISDGFSISEARYLGYYFPVSSEGYHGDPRELDPPPLPEGEDLTEQLGIDVGD